MPEIASHCRYMPATQFLKSRRELGGKTRLYELLNAGRIRGRKHGKTLLIDLQSVDTYLDQLPEYGKVA